METLAKFLQLDGWEPKITLPLDDDAGAAAPDPIDVTDPQEFCRHIVASREFRQYLLTAVTNGVLPPAILGRILDHAWGKPLERVQHTGKVETVTEVRRVVVHVVEGQRSEEPASAPTIYTKH